MKKIKRPDHLKHLGGHGNITHIDEGALNYLIQTFKIKSFLDIGCGPGGMVELALSRNLYSIGIDGDPIVKRSIDNNFILHDFCQGKRDLDRVFDLIWSCEFVEHVEEKFQTNYMQSFTLGKHIVLSYAPPGISGYHHVNCRDENYWINVFSNYGLQYDNAITKEIRLASTMNRNFIRENGLYFYNLNL